MRSYFLLSALALCLCSATATAQVEVRVASLAPKGSAWANIMAKGAADIETKTAGRVKVRFFFSGQQGDEKDYVRKMKLGQLDGAALTAVGLGQIKPEVRVLDLPFLFKSDKQLDYVRNKMSADFEGHFDSAGYVLLAWGDVGWTHIYSNIPLTSKADLANTKIWAWTDDPIVKDLFGKLGINGIPLGVPDVLPSLSTGKIDACYGSPLAAVALQWYTKVKHATEVPLSYAVGAFVVRKDVFNKLSADDQKIVRESGKIIGANLIAVVRKDNERAKNAMKKSGITFDASPPAFLTELEGKAKETWSSLTGKLYSAETLAKVKKLVAEAPR